MYVAVRPGRDRQKPLPSGSSSDLGAGARDQIGEDGRSVGSERSAIELRDRNAVRTVPANRGRLSAARSRQRVSASTGRKPIRS